VWDKGRRPIGRRVLDLVHNQDVKPSAVVNIHEAKTHLSRLLVRVSRGEQITIAKAGKPVARLVPIPEPPKRRLPGIDKGKIWMAPDFDEPLPEEILSEFYK
jgi:prevent-host-death family protein